MKGAVVAIMAVMLVLLNASCDGAGKTSGSQEPSKTSTGRDDTKAVKALDAVGYNGDQIRRNLDASLNKNDQRNKEIEEAVGK